MPKRIRVGAVNYLNAKPLIERLADFAPEIELSLDLPSRLADQLAVGEIDVGYGPARVLSSQQVRSLATALAALEPEAVAARVDLRKLDEEAIYPGNWQRNGMDVDYVVGSYREMRNLIVRLADQGLGMVLYIN